jgi:hypothetical protein
LDDPSVGVQGWWTEAAGNIALSMPAVKIGQPTATTVGGEEALLGSVDASQQDIYGWLALVIHDGDGYMFIALVSPQDSWAENKGAFDLMLSSVEFSD